VDRIRIAGDGYGEKREREVAFGAVSIGVEKFERANAESFLYGVWLCGIWFEKGRDANGILSFTAL